MAENQRIRIAQEGGLQRGLGRAEQLAPRFSRLNLLALGISSRSSLDWCELSVSLGLSAGRLRLRPRLIELAFAWRPAAVANAVRQPQLLITQRTHAAAGSAHQAIDAQLALTGMTAMGDLCGTPAIR
jgi:hypothetical protein